MTLDAATLTATGTFSVDVGTYIVLDADQEGNIYLNDGGVGYGQLSGNSGNLTIKSPTSDKKIIFTGNDGGSAITALTLDMSAEGNAHFNRSIGVGFAALPTGAAFDSIRLGGAGFFMSNSNTNASGITAMVHNGQYDADNSWEYIATDEAEYYYQGAGSHRFLSAPSGTAGNDITFVDRVEFEADGDVRIYDGNLVVAAGHGIDFAAQTQSDQSVSTTTSELLDHYEEGTWTPIFGATSLVAGSGSGETLIAYAQQTGFFTRIGNTVYIQGNIRTNGRSGTERSVLTVDGLPFAVNGSCHGAITVSFAFNFATAAPLSAIAQKSETHLLLYTNATGNTNLTTGNIAGSGQSYLTFEGFYQV